LYVSLAAPRSVDGTGCIQHAAPEFSHLGKMGILLVVCKSSRLVSTGMHLVNFHRLWMRYWIFHMVREMDSSVQG
jgi:hypothetical protein